MSPSIARTFCLLLVPTRLVIPFGTHHALFYTSFTFRKGTRAKWKPFFFQISREVASLSHAAAPFYDRIDAHLRLRCPPPCLDSIYCSEHLSFLIIDMGAIVGSRAHTPRRDVLEHGPVSEISFLNDEWQRQIRLDFRAISSKPSLVRF